MTTESHNPRPIGPPTPEGTFRSTDAAARAALRDAFRRTKRDGFESGGGIFKILVGRSAGQFSFFFGGGTRSRTSVGQPQRAPGRPGAAILVASFHSHTPGPGGDTFSDADFQNAFDAQKPSFMVGPSGKMWMLKPVSFVGPGLGALLIDAVRRFSTVTSIGRTR